MYWENIVHFKRICIDPKENFQTVLWRCSDGPSSYLLTKRHFNPNYPSSQQIARCDNSSLWHSFTATFRPGIFRPPGRFFHLRCCPPSSICLVRSCPSFCEEKCQRFVTNHLGIYGGVWAWWYMRWIKCHSGARETWHCTLYGDCSTSLRSLYLWCD